MYNQNVDLLRAEAARCLRLAFSIADQAVSDMLHRRAQELIDRIDVVRAGSLAQITVPRTTEPLRLLV